MMDTNMPQQVAAILRFKRFVELLSDPKEGRTYINGEPMAPDATAFLSYFRDIEQGYAEGLDAVARAAAAEAEAADAILVASDAAQREENAMHALSHFRARVAELEAQLAAQQWRPVTEDWPPYGVQHLGRAMLNSPTLLVTRTTDDSDEGWQDSDGMLFYAREIRYCAAIPEARPLPPAPQETE